MVFSPFTDTESLRVTPGVEYHAVSSRVNNSKSAGADLIELFPNPA
jgi:hypothetical protein